MKTGICFAKLLANSCFFVDTVNHKLNMSWQKYTDLYKQYILDCFLAVDLYCKFTFKIHIM